MTPDREHREQICEIGRRMYDKGMIAAADGNVSIRTEDGRLYITPSGACKGFLEPDEIVTTDLTGAALDAQLRPSSEIDMHVAIYDVRPDVRAVVHAHPPNATGFAASGIPLSPALLSEVVLTLGCVPLTEYATPTTNELAETLRRYAKDYDGLLLANHGAVTLGSDIFDAYYKMDTIEHYAKINLVTKILGSERPLPSAAVEKLMELRQKAGGGSTDPYCNVGPSGSETVTLTTQELVDLIVRVVDSSPGADTRT